MLSLITAAAMVAVLAACGGSGGTPESAAPQAPPSPPPAEKPPAAPEPAQPPPPEPPPPPQPPATPPPEPPPPPEPDPAPQPEPPPQPEPDPAPQPEPPPQPELAAGLPEDIAGYEDWVRLNPEPIPPIQGGDAHNGTKDVFTSREADRSGGISYPAGTIIVKEAIRPERDFIGLVAIMRKIEGFDPANNDWEFVEYTRSSPNDIFTIIASGGICSGCHTGAAATDFVWVHTTGDAP